MNEIKSISEDIKSLLENYTKRLINDSEADNQYKKLEKDYSELISSKEISNDYLKSICYYNNINNFSLFTGVYSIYESRLIPVAYYGDDKNNEIINQKFDDKIIGELTTDTKINIFEIDNVRYYIQIISYFSKEYFFISRSNSEFFSQDKFDDYCNLIPQILPKHDVYEDVIFNLKDISDYVMFNTNSETAQLCYIYAFPDLIPIFHHMGYRFIFSLHNKIFKILENDFSDSLIKPISLNCFFVFSTLNKNQNMLNHDSVPKTSFHFREIPIPYSASSVIIQDSNDFYKVVNKAVELIGKT